MLFIKNYMEMDDAERSERYVHCGPITVTKRIVKLILNSDYYTVQDEKRLQQAIDHTFPELDGHLQLLLTIECGKDVCRLNELDDKIVGYIDEGFDSDFLLNTPLPVMEMDFYQACHIIKEAFESQTPKEVDTTTNSPTSPF